MNPLQEVVSTWAWAWWFGASARCEVLRGAPRCSEVLRGRPPSSMSSDLKERTYLQ